MSENQRKSLRIKKQDQLKKKIEKREKKIELLKEIDKNLENVSFEKLSLGNKSNSLYVQNSLNQIERKLQKCKKKYYATEKKAKDSRPKAVKKLKKIEEKLLKLEKSTTKEDVKQQKKLEKMRKKHSLWEKIASEHENPKVLKAYADFQVEQEKQVYRVKVQVAHLRHRNKVTKDRLWWQLLSKEERKERRSDLSFYTPDVQGYWFTLLSVVAEIVYLVLLLGIMVRTFWVGITILVNIAFLLFLFTIAIKVKNYKKAFSFCSIVFGVYCIVRITWVIQGLMGVDLSEATMVKSGFIYGCNIYMILASVYVGLRSLYKIKRQEIYLKEEKISKIQLSK